VAAWLAAQAGPLYYAAHAAPPAVLPLACGGLQ
jgi:hypothetical protein